MANFARANLPTLKKTASYYLVHVTVAAGVAHAVTGNLLVSFTLSLLEPTVQAFAFILPRESLGTCGASGRCASVYIHRIHWRLNPYRYSGFTHK